jgi:EAL domain-containing protein (putative c-di-GMP-specific phosphodiesterase class I)
MKFKNENLAQYEEMIRESNKFKKWELSANKIFEIRDMLVENVELNEGGKIDSVTVEVSYNFGGENHIHTVVVGGGSASVMTVLIEEETDEKYLILSCSPKVSVGEFVVDVLPVSFNGIEVESTYFDIIDSIAPGIGIKPNFSDLTLLTTAFLAPESTDKSCTLFLFEKVVKANDIQILMNNFDEDTGIIKVLRLNEAIGKLNSMSSQFAYYAYLDFIYHKNHILEDTVVLNNPEDIDMINTIKYAIKNDKVLSLYQPVIKNESEQVVRYESLMRIETEEGELLTPYSFLDIAVRNNLYPQLTNIVFEQAVKILETDFFSIIINLNSADLHSALTKQKIYSILENNTKSRNENVIFELNEDEEYKDIHGIKTFIKKVKGLGAKIGIDDYGSSDKGKKKMLSFKPNFIKLRAELIKGIMEDPRKEEEVKKIVKFAEVQGIETVAPFVENELIFKKLKEIGVNFSQGYYFGKPEPLPL